MTFGVQTFTVRREQRRGLRQAYLPLAEMGIRNLEVARIDFDRKRAAELKAVTEELGLTVCSVQVKPKYIFGDPRGIIEFCKTVGCKNAVISMLPFNCILGSEERFYSFLGTLDGACELYAKEGVTLGYHHHNWEYITLSGGRTRMQEFIAGTRRLKFVHDTYWTARCGISPTLEIERFGDRLLGIHLRDLGFVARGIRVLPRNVSVGDGVIDFSSVIKAAESVGCSYYMIEQKTRTPYRDIEKSFAVLEAIKQELTKGDCDEK